MTTGLDDRAGTPFRFEYEPPVIRYGAGCVAQLGDELERHGLERALVVCGRTVGDTPAVMDPVREGLGDHLAAVFAETTPEKRLSTAFDARDVLREHDADVIVAVGGGSSLDVAKVTSALAADHRDPVQVGREFEERGTVSIPATDLVPLVTIPTTLAGADLTQGAGITAHPANGLVTEQTGGGISSRRLLATAAFYDPALVATTPAPVLAGSAMNGLDKGIESLYAATATPVTDATAIRGLQLLAPALHRLGADGPTVDTLEPVLEGVMLVQYGISRPDGHTMSVIHAFGHALTSAADLQQGVAHAIVAPHALDFLFDRVGGRRALLADAFGIDTDGLSREQVAAAIVDEVTAIRDALDLPAHLRDVEDVSRDAFPAIAEAVLDDSFMANAPPGLDATAGDLEAVLEAAW